jgi:hypothetical protein
VFDQSGTLQFFCLFTLSFTTKDHIEDTKITNLFAIFVPSFVPFVAISSQNFSLTPNWICRGLKTSLGEPKPGTGATFRLLLP